jgi:hypothetical protein
VTVPTKKRNIKKKFSKKKITLSFGLILTKNSLRTKGTDIFLFNRNAIFDNDVFSYNISTTKKKNDFFLLNTIPGPADKEKK